jgi:hypothetical protein
MKLKGGAIIIGSLLWDSKQERKDWRENNLKADNKVRVFLPIRYGRLSNSRRKTYTMVFSNNCYRCGLGTGWVVQFRTETDSFDDLKREAKEMGKAEGISNGLFCDWDVVSLILNPNKVIDNSIREEWTNLMKDKLKNHQLLKATTKSEKASIDSNGFLKIRWPKKVTNCKNIDLDFLLATPTLPTITKNRYPSIFQISNAMTKAKYCEYFIENIKNKITTFQDKKILDRLKNNYSLFHQLEICSGDKMSEDIKKR